MTRKGRHTPNWPFYILWQVLARITALPRNLEKTHEPWTPFHRRLEKLGQFFCQYLYIILHYQTYFGMRLGCGWWY